MNISRSDLSRDFALGLSHRTASLAGEKMAPVLKLEHLQREAALGRSEDFERFLKAVPDVPDLSEAHDGTPR